MAYSDRELLARLIQCEAGGEGDERNNHTPATKRAAFLIKDHLDVPIPDHNVPDEGTGYQLPLLEVKAALLPIGGNARHAVSAL